MGQGEQEVCIFLIWFKDLLGIKSSTHSQQLVMVSSSIQTDPETHPERRVGWG